MDAACCENARKQLIVSIIPILKPYLQKQENDKDLIDLLKALITVNKEFGGLLDIFIK